MALKRSVALLVVAQMVSQQYVVGIVPGSGLALLWLV